MEIPRICVPEGPLLSQWMLNLETYLISDYPFKILSNFDKQLTNAVRAARQGHFAGFYDNLSEAEGGPAILIILAICAFQSLIERFALIENASAVEIISLQTPLKT